ncbi:helix-turn-helix domain-containing protein [Sulfuricurvum sp.]|uniref:helix-turn-helix domain-containing protein n=1 Tax=Sulfuricurvum sp. TaxID=2025608 RepID=UPI003C5612A7
MFGERLERARKAAGLSLRALGEKVGVSQTAISKFEKDQLVPDSGMLLKLSMALGVKSEYFFRQHKVEINLESVEYRKREIPKKSLDLINAKILDEIEKRFELESFFPIPPIKSFVLCDELSEYIGTIQEIDSLVDKLRANWELGSAPILDLIDVLEGQGIRVFSIKDSIDSKFDGLAAKIHDQPVIVISSDWPGDRQRFTLAHELGHLVLKGRLSKEIDEEKAADRFAGAFLLPTHAIRHELGEHRNFIEIRELGLLKTEYGISMLGAVIRAYQTGIIEKKTYSAVWEMFKRNGWLKKEPGDQYPSEKPHVFEQLVFHALAEDFIGESKAAQFMGISTIEFYNIRMMSA